MSVNDVPVLSQIMLVDGYKGQKVQDVKKPIQKMMMDKVRLCLNDITYECIFINMFMCVMLLAVCGRARP